jgi:hypothetical protein
LHALIGRLPDQLAVPVDEQEELTLEFLGGQTA